jgi:hypothetical protein
MKASQNVTQRRITQFTLALGAFIVAGLSVAFAEEGGAAAGASSSVLNYLALASGLGLGLAALKMNTKIKA